MMNNQGRFGGKGYKYIDGVEQPKQKLESGTIGHAGYAVGRAPAPAPASNKAPVPVKKSSMMYSNLRPSRSFKEGGSVSARGQGAVMKKKHAPKMC